MVIKNVNLETVCGITSTSPDNMLDEVAFAGKSNVGKSSLINALMNRKALARTSSQPGKTQTINFYNVNESMYLVDLPGYGYANANVEIKAKWGQMIENYLHTSKRLKAVFLLIVPPSMTNRPQPHDPHIFSQGCLFQSLRKPPFSFLLTAFVNPYLYSMGISCVNHG